LKNDLEPLEEWNAGGKKRHLSAKYEVGKKRGADLEKTEGEGRS